MKISSQIKSLLTKSLVETFSIDLMQTLTREIIHNYDLHKATGYPENIPIPKTDGAKQIVKDLQHGYRFLDFIGLLIKIHYKGHMGKSFSIKFLKDLIKVTSDMGYIYDHSNGIFVENPAVRKSRNWGTLKEGEDYIFTFLRLDIAGNSELVRKYPENKIKKAYKGLDAIVEASIKKRNGRIWSWEGDGGLIAFYFSDKNTLATLCGMQIINELFIYNRLFCPLDEPLTVRLSAHNGFCEYQDNIEDLKKNEVIKHTIEIEGKFTDPNSFSISDVVYRSLDEKLKKLFNPFENNKNKSIHNYSITWEN